MHQIAEWLRAWNAEPVCWDNPGLFSPGDFILERLLALSQEVDGALVLFGDEDREWYHPNAQPQPRDNVLIEYGIFAGQLGRERVAVCRLGKPKNASDLGGLIFLQLPKSAGPSESDARDRLRNWVRSLPERMNAAKIARSDRLAKQATPAESGLERVYRPTKRGLPRIVVQAGTLKDVRGVDVIVSSENTDLQPARFYDRTMSGTLRYLDAEKNKVSLRVQRDAYVESLTAAIREHQVVLPVMLGSVLPVRTTGLLQQNVKFVFHAAVVEGKVGMGYEATETAIEDAIRLSFQQAGELAKETPISSILLPMFGAGSGRLSEHLAARRVVRAVATHACLAPAIETVRLFAHTDAHTAAFYAAVEEAGWTPS